MSKQGTRSKSKQGQAIRKPSNSAPVKTNGASSDASTTKVNSASPGGSTVKASNGSPDRASVKSTTASTNTTAATQKPVATQDRSNISAAKTSPGGAAKQSQPDLKPSGKSAKQQRKQ